MKNSLAILLIVLVFSSCTRNRKQYIPIVWENDQYTENKALLNEVFCENFIAVLTYYEHEYETDANCEIYISSSLFNDKDLLMNLTTKAQDSLWLSKHIKNENSH